MGAATATATLMMYQHNKRTEMSMFKASAFASCASAQYKIPSQAEIEKCRQDIFEFINSRKNVAPLMVRLSWHDAGTYDLNSNTGGPRAVMRFKSGES